jgi:TonB-linked SusC/RagA family outer membrane protein
MRKLLMLFSFLCCTLIVWSQQRRITGTVIDEQAQPVPSASVIIKGTNTGTTTKLDGSFSIEVNPKTVLVISGIGFQPQEITVGNQSSITVKLLTEGALMADVVVTGVSQATSQRKIPFSVSKVTTELINTVPALDLSQSLRAKVAGIQISQTQGDDAASVFLRGAKSMFGNIAPLIVLDGMVTNLSLGDLNPQDVETIEVVKGAAASALYGTRAEGGVIQVISKKGRNTKGVNITIDNEVGVNNIQRLPDLATLHHYIPDQNNEFGFSLVGTSRQINYKDNGYSVELSPYKNNYDNTAALLNNNTYFNNYVSLATSGDKFNAFLSFRNQETGGVVAPMDPNKKRSLTMRAQFRPTKKVEAEFSLNYFNEIKPSSAVSSNDQGTFFAASLQWEPFINLTAQNPDGSYPLLPAGAAIQAANLGNPLYEWSKRKYTNNTDDYLGGLKFRYKILDNLTMELQGSMRKQNYTSSSLYPKGYETQNTSETLNNGNLALNYSAYQMTNGQALLNYNTKFGNDFTFGATAKMVYENWYSKGFGVSGYDFSGSPGDIYVIGNTRQDFRSGSGSDMFTNKTVNYGYYLNVQSGWREKVFFDVLARIDQSSRYGSEAQDAFFPRFALAYRISEDYDLGNAITDLKLRVNWGAAGSVPGYNYKNSLATITSTGLRIDRLENTKLSRSITHEWEFGFDAILYNKINVNFNYAFAKSQGDVVNPGAFTPWEGAGVYKNFGVTKSRSLELEVNGNAVATKNFSWDFTLTFGRVRSKIIELGEGLTPFPSGLYFKDAGLSPFAMWGQVALTSLDQLEVDKNTGLVVNAAGGTRTLDEFVVNDRGFVVLASTVGTSTEAPLFLQKEGSNISTQIGDVQPDFQLGFSNTFTFFKRFSIYSVFDWKQGGQKYDQTTQYLTSGGRSAIWQDYASSGLPLAFIQGLYNGNSYTNYWVMNSTYFSLRELSVSYDIPAPKKWNLYKSAKIALVGRNLFTWTKFPGSNPEGASEYFPYPVFRTYTARLILNL